MRSQLKRTSSKHMPTFNRLGMCMLPLQRSIPAQSELSIEKGRQREKNMK